ncbi:hypothetical protein FZI85_19780 [Mycobacterium sp. CBMA293]|uniref:hypothetical protein n=1 Tax=unclassified Mycolicibacterium TaxID=2636767 RepID=UPI0012DD772D|nr:MULTISPECIES: hypothetical protein [unclassified Mycolicibacterium]MUL49063.1 hypothetical protein [Mycolicibacterium sp. CBMA 360]MUL60923.1 hypothetical protein [Mycolicibacterium sp. CBMA 335]MUL71936.1 hypothetical protein [Mycolicibacterium sp. CBMA 311]MUL95864.1 hypothetical protein [Mycolicibacterium sp. CBMA 230]MUM09041.1 hypothetical protein [Mycolicibacterium sp. CBMA 213]
MAKKFKLPANWYRSTVTDLVENRLPPLLGELTTSTAWAYVYAITMWSEQVAGRDYLHIVESDKLNTNSGRVLADHAADYLKEHLVAGSTCDPFALVDQIGSAYLAERAKQGLGPPKKKRDPNVTGAAFETSLQVLIGKLCGFTPSRTPRLRTLQGFELAPTGYHSRPDLVLFGPRDFRLLISTKWTLRKERIGTYLHESYFYRRRRPDLQIAFAVNEFQPNILRHLSTDPLVDRVYHVNKQMLLALYAPFSGVPSDVGVPPATLTGNHPNAIKYRRWLHMHDHLFDLTDLFADIRLLIDKPGQVLDPDANDVEGDPGFDDLDD